MKNFKLKPQWETSSEKVKTLRKMKEERKNKKTIPNADETMQQLVLSFVDTGNENSIATLTFGSFLWR